MIQAADLAVSGAAAMAMTTNADEHGRLPVTCRSAVRIRTWTIGTKIASRRVLAVWHRLSPPMASANRSGLVVGGAGVVAVNLRCQLAAGTAPPSKIVQPALHAIPRPGTVTARPHPATFPGPGPR